MPDTAVIEETTAVASKKFSVLRLWPIALVLAGLAAFYASGASQYLSLDTIIRERMALTDFLAANYALALATYVAVYVAAVSLSFPGASLITILGGFLFGVVAGTILTVIAATIGASIIFLIAKTSLGEALRSKVGKAANRLAEGFEADAFNYLLFLRLVPVFPFWLINIAPAMFKVKLPAFAAATALGIIPGTAAYCLLGSGLNGVIEAQEAANPGCAQAGTCEIDPGALVTPGLVGAMVALALVSLIPIAVKKWRASRKQGAAQ